MRSNHVPGSLPALLFDPAEDSRQRIRGNRAANDAVRVSSRALFFLCAGQTSAAVGRFVRMNFRHLEDLDGYIAIGRPYIRFRWLQGFQRGLRPERVEQPLYTLAFDLLAEIHAVFSSG